MTCRRREPRATGTGISRISPRFPPTISIKKRFEVQKHIFIQGKQTKKNEKGKENNHGSVFKALSAGFVTPEERATQVDAQS